MKSFRLVIVLLSFGLGSGQADSYFYGIADDNKIHQVDLNDYMDAAVFDTGLTGATNGVAWDGASGRLFYRDPSSGKLYTWDRARNLQQLIGGSLLGVNSDAAYYAGGYWYIADNTDTLVKATLDFSNSKAPIVLYTQEFTDFDHTPRTQFGFGDIAISKTGMLYASTNFGLVSMGLSSSNPQPFQVVAPNLGIRQIAWDETQSFLYSHDHASGRWFHLTLDGIETPIESAPGVTFTSAALRDISEIAIGNEVPEPASWQLLLAGAALILLSRLKKTKASIDASCLQRLVASRPQ